MESKTFNLTVTELCAAAETIRNNKILWIILACELVLFTIAVFLCSIFLYLIYRHAFIHINARLLLANLTFNVLLTAIADIFHALFSLIKFALYSGCDLLESYNDCRRKFLPIMVIGHATIFSVFVLIAERVCATLFARRYEKKATKKIVIVVIALEWLAVVGYTIFMVASSFFSTESKNGSEVSFIFTCKSGFTQPEVSISSHIAATLVFAAFLLILTGVILLNRYKYSVAYINKTKHTLSERFQLHENIRGTRLLLPGVAVQCVMSLGGVTVLVIVDKRFRFIHDQAERIVLMYPVYEWINLLIAVCTLLYPIVSIAFSSVLAKAAWDMLNCRKQQKRIIVQENMSAEKKNAYTKQGSFRPIPTPTNSGSAQKHFAKLTATWEKTFHKKVGVLSVGNSLSSTMSLK